IRSNDAATVEKLLRSGIDPNLRETPPPPRTGGEVLSRLANPPGPETDQPTALFAALTRQRAFAPNRLEVSSNPNLNPAIVRSLLSHGANVNATVAIYPPPIAFAVMAGN